MKIFEAEKEDGLSQTLSAKSSIVYASLLEKSDPTPTHTQQIKENKALAGIEDSDLYYTQSILVTTSWNKNDDIFDPKEVWAAKDTPTHKPTNLEHDEASIVGHITSNWPIDDNGNIIETENLPNKFHILTGSVIYTGYTEPELRSRAANLIDEIESGNKYVSMECFFRGFDYGLIDKTNGTYHILPRNEATAFLTKHLRAYGGMGEHENYKIGRVLRGITFSGKGFVNKPANPESIIFTKDNLRLDKQIANEQNFVEKNDTSTEVGVFSNQANLKETNMSVEAEVTQAEETTVVTETPATEVAVETSATVEAPVVVEAQETVNNISEEENKTLKAELDAALEALAAYKKKEEMMAKKDKMMKRMAALVDSGVDNELATSSVEKFESIDDSTFETITTLIAAMKPAKVAKKDMVKAEETVDVSEALENVETDQAIDLSVGNETESEMQNTRAALVDFVCIRLGKKLNKGE